MTGRTAAGRRRQLDTGMPGRHGGTPCLPPEHPPENSKGWGGKTRQNPSKPDLRGLLPSPSVPFLPSRSPSLPPGAWLREVLVRWCPKGCGCPSAQALIVGRERPGPWLIDLLAAIRKPSV